MERRLSFDLHVLTALLDRAADRILRAELGVSYRRFLALTHVGQLAATTQRALAESLGVTEPSVSRMTAVLADDGWLAVRPDPAGGHRRQLALTPDGERLVGKAQALLEDRFAALVEASGVQYDEYAASTERMLAVLR